jgi:hypothetical protein
MITKKQKLINGPVIIMRLEGNINGINKVFYLFGDDHKNLEEETKCSSYNSEDFIQYFRKTMKNTDKNINYDFFLEMEKNDIFFNESFEKLYEKKFNYLLEIRKFFKYKQMNKSKNNNNKEKNNLTVYYCDIRDYFDIKYHYENDIYILIEQLHKSNNVNNYNINYLKNILSEMNKSVESTTNILLNNKKNPEIYNQDDEFNKKNIK